MNGVYYNDNEPFCCAVLRKNIDAGYLPGGYVDERDIRQLHATDFVGYSHVHLFAGIGGFPLGMQRAGYPASLRTLTGGFPCQDISNAGKRAGITGERSGLWKEMYRLICEALDNGMGFDYILVENVAALVLRGIDTVLGDLAQIGYDAEWQCLRASDIGAPHRRERLFIVAYPQGVGRRAWGSERKSAGQAIAVCDGLPELAYSDRSQRRARTEGRQDVTHGNDAGWQEEAGGPSVCCEAVANARGARLEKRPTFTGDMGTQCATTERGGRASGTTGQPQLRICGESDGLSNRLDGYQWPAGPGEEQHIWEPARTVTGKQPHRVNRLKALGNAIVPQCIEVIARRIVAFEIENGVA